MHDIDKAIKVFVAKCQEVVDKHYKQYGWDNKLSIIKGRRYEKIASTDDTDQPTTRVWAFIDKTNGDVLKPAGWKAPAKHPRGNIYDEHDGMRFIGAYGPSYMTAEINKYNNG